MKKEQANQPTNAGRWVAVIIILIVLSMISFIASFIIGIFLSVSDTEQPTGNVAHIKIAGPILSEGGDGMLSGSVAESTEIVKLIEKANKNEEVKAILLEINSPGGTAVASYELADAVSKSNKTTVAWIREAGASGAYWVASSSDYIVANPLSITGSIGVIASYIEISGTLTRYNASYQRLVAGKYKDMANPLKKMSQDEEEIMQENLDELRDFFVRKVSENRKLPLEDVEKLADGRFYLGKQAKENGLVDELGGKEEAVKWIEKKLNITAEIADYEKPKTLMDALASLFSDQSFHVGEGIGKAMLDAKVSKGVTIST